MGTGPSSQGWVRRVAPPLKALGKAEAPSRHRGEEEKAEGGKKKGETERELSALR